MAVANMATTMPIGRLMGVLTRHLYRCFKETILTLPLLIVGSPGLGKTDITKAAKDKVKGLLGAGAVVNLVIMHPVTKSDVDFAGHPVFVNGQAFHVVYGDLQNLIAAADYTICLIDDVGQSKLSVQAPIMQLVREREINGHKISDRVQFVLATNTQADRAGVQGLIRPLANRCVQVTVTPDPDALADWLRTAYPTVPVVEAFVRHRPGYILGEFVDADQVAGKIGTGIVTPRSVANVAELMQFGYEIEDLAPLLVGTVGMGFTTEFLGFVRVWKSVTPYRAIIADPAGAKLPTSIDGNYAQVGMIAQQAKRPEMAAVGQYVYRMSAEYRAYFWNLVERSRKDLLETKEYQEYRMAQNY